MRLVSTVSFSPALAGNTVVPQAVTQPLQPQWVLTSSFWHRYWVQVSPDYLPTEPTLLLTDYDIEYWWLHDGGHPWSGSFNLSSEPVNQNIDTSEVMLDFFDAHAL